MKPDFIGIGVPKAGTTSLHHYLDQHPDVFMAPKEPHYFVHADGARVWQGPGDAASTQNDVHTWADYQAAFADAGDLLAGEYSPQYLADPDVPQRIRDALPDAKFLVMLRDPTARTYSNFLHLHRNGREKHGLAKALEKEPARLAAGWEPFWGYRKQSQYAANFAPWLEVFPKDRFLVMTLKQLKQEPEDTMARVHDFLGLAPHTPDFRVYNPGGVGRIETLQRRLLRKNPLGGATRYLMPKSLRFRMHHWMRRANSKYPPIPPKWDARLRQEYLPEVEALEDMFDLDLAAWKPRV